MKRIGIAAALALAAGLAATTPAAARVVVASVRVAPPPPRVERVVVRTGHVWVGGYWRWNGTRHVWIAGHAAPVRPGFRYVPAQRVHVGPAWSFHRGYWHRC